MLPSRILKSPTRPTSIRTLFMERSLRCQLGVLNLDRVLPSRTRTDALFFRGSSLADAAVTRTRRFGLAHSRCQFFLQLP